MAGRHMSDNGTCALHLFVLAVRKGNTKGLIRSVTNIESKKLIERAGAGGQPEKILSDPPPRAGTDPLRPVQVLRQQEEFCLPARHKSCTNVS